MKLTNLMERPMFALAWLALGMGIIPLNDAIIKLLSDSLPLSQIIAVRAVLSLVLVAVLVSLLKYSLPYANDYKAEIEALITEQVGTNIAIGSISAGWEHTGPALVLNQVSFGKNQPLALGLYVEQSRLHVNVWQSVLQRRLVSNYFVLYLKLQELLEK